jgi:hypothetical protein
MLRFSGRLSEELRATGVPIHEMGTVRLSWEAQPYELV